MKTNEMKCDEKWNVLKFEMWDAMCAEMKWNVKWKICDEINWNEN